MAELKYFNAFSIGILSNTDCQSTTFTKNNYLHDIKDLSQDDIKLLKYRLEMYESSSTVTICEHHKCKYLTYYSQSIKKCSNPFGNHEKAVQGDRRILKLDFCETVLENLKLTLIPGKKICRNCEKALKTNLSKCMKEESNVDAVNIHNDNHNIEVRRSDRLVNQEKPVYFSADSLQGFSQKSSISSCSSEFVNLSQEQKEINNLLTHLGMPNLENSQVFRTRRERDANNLIDSICRHFAKQCSTALNMKILIPEPISPNIVEDSSILKQLLVNIQTEFEHSKTINKKLQCLALLPKDWSQSKICEYLPCTLYLFRKLS